jgi:CRP-like cAMP-binding protein
LRRLRAFREFSEKELDFVRKFKSGELAVDRGATIVVEGSHSAHLYTVLVGWGFRYKLLSDGRRQILNYAMPGDLIGLQATLMGEMQHSVEALSPMVLCVFERDKLYELYRSFPQLAYDITWIAAHEEQILDENLLSVGRRTSLERMAYLLAFLFQRASEVALSKKKPFQLSITQQHVADTLGLSLVHTNRTIRKLVRRRLLSWRDRGCEVLDLDGLLAVARWDGRKEEQRPFV